MSTVPKEYDGIFQEPAPEESFSFGDPTPAPTSTHLPARSLADFLLPASDDPATLIGDRYLSRGDGCILVGSSGMGKSSLSVQTAICWALGRPMGNGLRPSRPLRSLIMQSEDSDGDIAEMRLGMYHAMALGATEQATIASSVRIVTDRIHRGLSFYAELKHHVETFQPDIVWINPLLAFIDGDVNDAEAAGRFLREQLNSLNEPARFAYIVIHHTAKPPKERTERRWSEVMYDMAGSADLTNWARAIISLRPSDHEGRFNLVFAKRGLRAGYTEKVPGTVTGIMFDQPTTTIGLKHSKEWFTPDASRLQLRVIHWESCDVSREATPTKSTAGRKSKYLFEDFRIHFPKLTEDPQPPAAIQRRFKGESGISPSTFRDMCASAHRDGFLERVERPGLGGCFRLLDHPTTGGKNGAPKH